MTSTRQQPVITLSAAQELTRYALQQGDELGGRFSVTVAGPGMDLIAFAEADGATPHSVDSSRRKANTSASTTRPTGRMQDDLALALPLATNLQLTNFLGGAALVLDGETVGAIGIAGGTPAQDEQAATAAAYAGSL